MQDNPWRNEELVRCEEALPRLIVGDLEKASRMYKAQTGVGCDRFHPKVFLDLTKETRRNCGILGEGGAAWQVAAASVHNDVLLDSEECYTSKADCAHANVDSLVGSSESARSYRVDWDTTDGWNRGTQRTV